MIRARRVLALAPLLLLAGCAYTPAEVEQRRTDGYALAQGAHDKILADTDANYAREMHAAQEWNMPSLFGLPAQAVTGLAIAALVVIVLIVAGTLYTLRQVRANQAAEQREAANTREQQITERKRIDKDVAKALQEAHDCPCCSATPKEQLTAQRVLDAAQEEPS